MNWSPTVKGRFWLHHHPRINQPSVDIIFLRPLIISLLLLEASFASDFQPISFETMTASFEQTNEANKNSTNNISKGYLVIKRPNLMLWQINEPTQRIIMFEGGLISIFDPDLNQVIRTEIDQFEGANWIRILMGESELINDYKQQIDEFDSYKLIKYEPLFNDNMSNVITIKIKEELIEYIDIEQSEKERIHIKFKDIGVNVKIDDGFFEDLIPDDADVIQ